MSAGIHIVSTRVLSDTSVHKLTALGWQFSAHDFIRKQIGIPENLSAQLLPENIVITSQSGVEAFLKILDQYQLSKDAFQLYCIDQATQKSATEAGLHIKASAPHAASLADKILSDRNIKAVAHICSNRRRDELSEKLKSAGVKVQDVAAYHTDLTPVKITADYDAVTFFSPSAIDSFLSLNPFRDVPCFCIGKTTDAYARQKGYTNTLFPERSAEEELIDLLIHYFSNTPVHVKE
jgi:uroporphyrinogen-III synthase